MASWRYHGAAMHLQNRALALCCSFLTICGVACGGGTPDPVAPAATAVADDPPEKKTDDTATLDVYGNPPTKVLIDGKPAGTTPIQGYKVKPGSHDVTWADELTGNRTMSVTLEPGDGKVMTSDRPPSATQQQKPADKPKAK
jgi:hypothetical protein